MNNQKTVNELHFIYRQKGKVPEKGVLTALALCGKKSTVLLIDSFSLTGEMRRRKFVSRLYEGERMLDECSFPKATLTQCLLEMASDALSWGEPSLKKVKPLLPDKPLKGIAFEKMLAGLEFPPKCRIERAVFPQQEGGA